MYVSVCHLLRDCCSHWIWCVPQWIFTRVSEGRFARRQRCEWLSNLLTGVWRAKMVESECLVHLEGIGKNLAGGKRIGLESDWETHYKLQLFIPLSSYYSCVSKNWKVWATSARAKNGKKQNTWNLFNNARYISVCVFCMAIILYVLPVERSQLFIAAIGEYGPRVCHAQTLYCLEYFLNNL